MRRFLAILSLALACAPAYAADFYIAQTALGTGSGTSAANAKAYTFFTTAANWNGATSATICSTSTYNTVRDTVHLVGTISSPLAWPYATSTGAAGLLIYFEPGAKLSAPTWPSGAINWESGLYSKHHVTIDGGANGVIECTDNGTNRTYQVGSSGIAAISASFLTVQNLTISNIFVRVAPSENETTGSNGIAVSSGGGAFTDLTVQNCVIHDVENGIIATWGNGAARYSFLNNEIYNVNWGIGSGSATTDANFTGGWLADGNNIHDFANWDETGEAFHHNGIFIYGNNGTNAFTGGIIRNNTFGPNFGTRATSGVYLSSYGITGALQVYNNLFRGATTNGLLTIGTGNGSSVRAYNNTFILSSSINFAVNIGGSSSTGMSVFLENNLVSGGAWISGNYVTTVTLSSNKNLDFGSTAPGPVSWSTTDTGSFYSWASWQGTGQDAASVYNQNPLLSVTYKLTAGSPAIGTGANESAYFTTDKDGATRTVPWDMGAYAYSATGAPVITLNPVSQTATAGAGVSFTAAASGSPTPTWQWFKNGSQITGQTSTTLFLASVTTANNGSYYATATNGSGSATTSTATLTVGSTGVAPVITLNPTSRSVVAGASTTFTATASGNPSPTWQWYFNGAIMPGQIAASLTLTGIVPGNAGGYYARATNVVGTAQTSTAALSVTSSPTTPLKAPTITSVK